VLGGDVERGSGGKGANQAVTASRLGSRVAMIGCVGDDDAGRWLRDRLVADGVDVQALTFVGETPTGTAVVMVDSNGENSIVVSPGANRRLRPTDLDAASSLLGGVDVVLTQLEIPLDVVRALPAATSARSILNPAPAADGVPLDGFDIVVPNRGELASLADADPATDLASVADQARALDTAAVVVTLGSEGAMLVTNSHDADTDVVVVPAADVKAVDTTAAGDSFCGALAVAIVEGATLTEAVRWAVQVAGVTVTKRGAQDSLPRRAAVGSWAPGGA
jgi:ribokinase